MYLYKSLRSKSRQRDFPDTHVSKDGQLPVQGDRNKSRCSDMNIERRERRKGTECGVDHLLYDFRLAWHCVWRAWNAIPNPEHRVARPHSRFLKAMSRDNFQRLIYFQHHSGANSSIHIFRQPKTIGIQDGFQKPLPVEFAALKHRLRLLRSRLLPTTHVRIGHAALKTATSRRRLPAGHAHFPRPRSRRPILHIVRHLGRRAAVPRRSESG